jgi:hypothetical protein
MASDLITLNDYLTATGGSIDELETPQQAQLERAISSASSIIRNYLDRDVKLASEDATPATRTFRYNGGGLLDIDDATEVTSVATAITPASPASRVLQPQEWAASATSSNLPVLDTIELWTRLPFAQSPAMGFQWNEDTYGWRFYPVSLDVTAIWGWAEIPLDLQQAVVWQVADVITPESPYISEAIDGYSHSMREARGTTNVGPINAVSGRVQALLDPYVRVNV